MTHETTTPPDYPRWYVSSNILDKLMRSQNKYFRHGQHFHGNFSSANKRCRVWAILHNYYSWKKTVKKNIGSHCPAEKLIKKQYHKN